MLEQFFILTFVFLRNTKMSFELVDITPTNTWIATDLSFTEREKWTVYECAVPFAASPSPEHLMTPLTEYNQTPVVRTWGDNY